MNRRTFLRWLGLVPVVGPAAVRALGAPTTIEWTKIEWLGGRTVSLDPIFTGALGRWGGVTLIEHAGPVVIPYGEAMDDPLVEECELASVAAIRGRLWGGAMLGVGADVFEAFRRAPGFEDVRP